MSQIRRNWRTLPRYPMDTKLGILCFALGEQYQRMAAMQAISWRRVGLPTTVVTTEPVPAWLSSVANIVVYTKKIRVPFAYEADAYDLSPYDVTLKTDADLIAPPDVQVDLSLLDGVMTGLPVTVTNAPILSSPYRKHWSKQISLPEIYSAFFAFSKGDTAKAFFNNVRQVFTNFFLSNLSHLDKVPSTDLAYSVAWARMWGTDRRSYLPFIHMKPGITGLDHPDSWTDTLPVTYDTSGLYLGGLKILRPFHYYDKRFEQCMRGWIAPDTV